MSISRREFLRRGSLLTGAVLTHQRHKLRIDKVRPALDARSLPPFVDPLPILTVAKSAAMRASPTSPSVKIPYYRVNAGEFFGKVHRDLKPTRMWGFGSTFPGPTFDIPSGQEILVEWVNALPNKHFLPIDHSLHGAEAELPESRMVAHLHGAKASPENDGYPENWTVPGKSVIYHYSNKQDAAMLWYHDHAMGINRLNVFAGLAGAYILRDETEASLRLPRGKYEIPLVICDRAFDKDSQLYYPESGDPKSPWVPEFFGDAYLVNGKLFPYLEVEARRYRFRVLNVSNGRFYRLSLSNKMTMHQIGTDQGLLAAPVPIQRIVIAPGERLDLIIDFRGHEGEKFELKDDAVSVMQFRVSAAAGTDDSELPGALRPIEKLKESSAVKTRMLSLDEVDDLVQNPMTMLLNGKRWHDPVTENPVLNSVEIWNLINPTDDSHPIHLHLVRFQTLDRQRFEPFAFVNQKQLRFTGPATPPDASEAGWKDTVRAEPGMVTRIIVPFEGYAGRYVWHCHILEHEDNEMMRPFDVIPIG